MIEIKIPKEINKYEAKFIGPFSLRQTICICLALPACVLIFNFLKPYLGSDATGFVCIIPASIGWLFGWFKPYGMKFEKFLRSCFISAVLSPTKRKYKSKNYFETLNEMAEKEAQEASVGSKSKSKKKNSKNSYKQSSLAIK